MKRVLWLGLAIVCLTISLPLLAWGFWPPQMATREVTIQFPTGGPSLPGERSLVLKVPEFIRAGDSAVAELSLLAEGETAKANSVFDEYIVIAEARLDLPFAEVRPANLVSTTLAPGGTATFYWEIRPREEGTLRGEVWLYARFVPKEGDGEETRIPVSVQQVQVRSGGMWTRTGSEARAMGVVGTVIGLALGFLSWKRRAK